MTTNNGDTVAMISATIAHPVETVGYKCPPHHSRFKPGQSGNPRGRPRKKETMVCRLSKIFTQEISIRQGEKKRRISSLEAIVASQLQKAFGGDARAAQFSMKIAKELGFLDSIFEARSLRPADFRSGGYDLSILTNDELEIFSRLCEKCYTDPIAAPLN